MLIDLQNKPHDFKELYARASGGGASPKVPLLELDGEPIAESIDISRRVASLAGPLFSSESRHIDPFVSLWTDRVEPAYYDVICAESDPEVQRKRAQLVFALSEVENSLWARAMETG